VFLLNIYYILPSYSQDEKLLVNALHCTVQLDDNLRGRSGHILRCLGCVSTLHFLLIPQLTQEDREPVRYLMFLLSHHCHHTILPANPAKRFVIIFLGKTTVNY
jgi:hypothetical protein